MKPNSLVARVRGYVRRCATIRDVPGPLEKVVMSFLCVGSVLLVWYVLTAGSVEKRIIDPITLPSLGETVRSFPQLWFERAVARGAIWSLGRVAGGFMLAAAVAVPLGVTAGAFLRVNAFLRPLSIFGRNIPIAALIPLTLVWFGLGESQKVMFIFFTSVAFIFFDSVGAIEGVPDSYLDASYTLGARYRWRPGLKGAVIAGVLYGTVLACAFYWIAQRPGPNDVALRAAWRLHLCLMAGAGLVLGFVLWYPILAFQPLRKVLLPLAMPDIVNSLRLLFGLAFGYIMLAEVINAQFGLGAIINMSQRQGPREHIYLALILIALLAYAIDRTIFGVQRRLFPYRRTRDH